ncbi:MULTISPECIES: hypothetical protein [Micrococcaceae]|jgi:hypothetical protein|uniref:hypothetical protein n=1 Tax=Micrococcaceae TaxID=1268 RepID=UPI000B1D0344|nr:hypothetical protein [Arthrobacter sp. Soil764]
MLQQNTASIEQLWLRYYANGGNADPLEFEAYIYGLLPHDDLDALILSWAIEDVATG